MTIVLRRMNKGSHCVLYAMGLDGDFPVQAFLQEMKENHTVEFDKLLGLLDHTAQSGPPRNEQKCRFFQKERVFELKTRGGIRVMAFWDAGNVIICSHGFLKKSQKTPPGELVRAVKLREAYFQAKESQSIQIEPASGDNNE